MPVPAEHLDEIAATVAQLYRSAETSLVRLMAKHLGGDLDRDMQAPEWVSRKLSAVQDLRRGAQAVVAGLTAASEGAFRDAAAEAFRAGHASAAAELPKAWFPRSGIGQAAGQSVQHAPGFAAIEALAAAVHRDATARALRITRDVLDQYRAITNGAVSPVLAGAATRRDASQAMWTALTDRGLTSFVDRSGRRWQLSSYAEMAARSVTARAAVEGQMDRLGSLGVDLVIVSDHGQECALCRPYERQILRRDNGPTGNIQVEHGIRDGEMVTVDVKATLDQARMAGLMHPNCRHSVSAYLPGVTRLPAKPESTRDPDGDKARQRQRAIERKIRAAKMRVEGALDEPARKAAKQRVTAAQAEMREHLAANPKLKRLPYREQIGGGNTPPAGAVPNPAAPVRPLGTQDALDLGTTPAPKTTPKKAAPKPVVKPKTEAKPTEPAKAAPTQEPKAAPKVEKKAEPQPAPKSKVEPVKATAKPEVKTEAAKPKPAPKVEPKSEPAAKPAKPEPKAQDAKPEPKPKVEPVKPAPKADVEVKVKPVEPVKVAPKPAAKPTEATKPAPKPEPKVKPAVKPAADPKSVPAKAASKATTPPVKATSPKPETTPKPSTVKPKSAPKPVEPAPKPEPAKAQAKATPKPPVKTPKATEIPEPAKPPIKPKATPKPKPEVEPEVKPEPAAKPKPEPKAKPKPEPKPIKPEPRPEVKPEPKPKPEPKREPAKWDMPNLLPTADSTPDDIKRIESIMRATFEGTYGKSGLRVEMDEMASTAGAVSCEGTIYDQAGKKAGTWSRRISRDEKGAYYAYHSLLELDPDYQGQGFAKAFNSHLTNTYIASGISYIRLFANIDVGGYAWARAGYHWASHRAPGKVMGHMRGVLDEIRAEIGQLPPEDPQRLDWEQQIEAADSMGDRITAGEFGADDYPTPWDISQVGWREGATDWIGKRILMGSNWNAVKHL